MKTLIDRLEPKTGWTWKSKAIAWLAVAVFILAGTLIWAKVVDKGVDAIPDGKAQPLVYQTNGDGAHFRSMVPVVHHMAARVPPPILVSPSILLARFKAGTMGNSSGVTLPPNVKAAALAQSNTAQEKSRTWWRGTLNTGACVSQLSSVSWCLNNRQWANDNQYTAWKAMTKIKLTCGGAAIIGYIGGAWKGALLGASGCAWTELVAMW